MWPPSKATSLSWASAPRPRPHLYGGGEARKHSEYKLSVVREGYCHIWNARPRWDVT